MDYTLSKRELDFLRESNAIEGVYSPQYLPYKEEIEGHDGAWKFLRDKARIGSIVTLDDICHAQRLIIEEEMKLPEYDGDLAPSEVGVFRSVENPHNISWGSIIKPHFIDVPFYIDRFHTRLAEALPRSIDPLKDAAVFHREFEDIHPFTDGNGRTGRLVANYMLTFKGQPIIVFSSQNKKVYYDALSPGLSIQPIVDYFRSQASRA